MNSSNKKPKAIVQHFWEIFFPYWPAFLCAAILSIACAWTYTKFQKPLYRVSASILIKDESKGNDDSGIAESLNLIHTKKIVENEIEVLTSRTLMNRVVDSLKLFEQIYADGRWKDELCYHDAPFTVELEDPSSLPAKKRISIVFKEKPITVELDGKTVMLNKWTASSVGKLRISLVNRPSWAKGYKYSAEFENPKVVVEKLLSNLSVMASSKLSTVIDLNLTDPHPKLSEDILNKLIQLYSTTNDAEKNSLANNALQFIQNRLDLVAKTLDSTEKKIAQYKSSQGMVDLSSQGKLFLENVSANDQQLSSISMQLGVLGEVEKYINGSAQKISVVPSTIGLNEPLLNSLLDKLNDAQLQKEKLRNTTGENSPTMKGLQDQIIRLRQSAVENIRNQRNSLESNKRSLSETNSNYSSVLNAMPAKEKSLVEITRQQKIQSEIYSFLLEKREEAAFSVSSTVSDNKIVDMAEASFQQVNLDRKYIYLLALLTGLGLTAAVIGYRELFNSNILYRSEIEALTAIPVIAELSETVPGTTRSDKPVAYNMKNNEFSRLSASLNFLGFSAKRNILLVTSALPGEGKSFVAMNIAQSLSMAKKKTVIVEGDLYNPSVSKKFGLDTGNGLSNFLSGFAELDEILTTVPENADLFVITCGNIAVSNASSLLASARMKKLIDSLSRDFEQVIIDAPPFEVVPDAFHLSTLASATLMVIRHNYTPKNIVERFDELNRINPLKNLGIVFNAVKSRGIGPSKYRYGYHHHSTVKPYKLSKYV